jgi:hypothetical protein
VGLLAVSVGLLCFAAAPAQQRTPPAAVPAPQPAPAPAPVDVHTSVSRTAVWVGDRVTYSIELRCAPQVDIVTDDLATERLQVEGVEIRDAAINRESGDDGRLTYRANYTLVTFNVGAKALRIGDIAVRYSIRRPGQLPGDQAHPAGVVHIPPLKLVLRSTLLDGDVPVEIRDGRPLQPLPRRVAFAQPVGIGLLLLAAAPVGFLIFNLARRARRVRSRGPKRVTRRERRASLEEIKALDVASPEVRRDAYAKLDVWIRDHARQTTGVAAAALTPPEFSGAMMQPDRATPRLEQIQALLVECERAKYAAQPPDQERWSAALIEAEQLLDGNAG